MFRFQFDAYDWSAVAGEDVIGDLHLEGLAVSVRLDRAVMTKDAHLANGPAQEVSMGAEAANAERRPSLGAAKAIA